MRLVAESEMVGEASSWLDEEAPEEALAGNPYEPGSQFYKQCSLGLASRWRVQKRIQARGE